MSPQPIKQTQNWQACRHEQIRRIICNYLSNCDDESLQYSKNIFIFQLTREADVSYPKFASWMVLLQDSDNSISSCDDDDSTSDESEYGCVDFDSHSDSEYDSESEFESESESESESDSDSDSDSHSEQVTPFI